MGDWFLELLKGFGRFFMNPLVYWSIILVLLSGIRRIRKERLDFGTRVHDVFSEWRGTLLFTILAGLGMSLLTLGFGMVFSVETLVLLSVVIFVLSIFLNFAALSPVYTIGVTFGLLFVLPIFVQNEDFFTNINFVAISILLGLLVIVEAIFLRMTKPIHIFPGLKLSNRGVWIGQARIKRFALIPVFFLIPMGTIPPIEPYWPYLSIGAETYGLVLFPFLLGIQFTVKGTNPTFAVKAIAKKLLTLGIVVTLVAIGSIFISWLAIAAVILAIIGKEFIQYRFRVKDGAMTPYFHPENNGLKVLGVIPGTPAQRLGILAGETIAKVNGKQISHVDEFYAALHDKNASYRLDVLDERGEVRFVQGALFEGDHYKLGILFTEKPFRDKKNKA